MTLPTQSRPMVSRRQLLSAGTGLGAAMVLGIRPARAAAAPVPGVSAGLDVLVGDYPRAWFFRQTEDSQEFASYDEWEAQFRLLDGVQGKAFLEERDFDGARTRDFFSRFKQRHPEQVALQHFNGKGRRPTFNGGAFSAGHWLYYAGTSATTAAGPAAQTLQVDDASVFKTERPPVFPAMPDDVVIVPPGDGGLNWAGAEQARLVEADYDANTITVQRGQFGTSPIEIPAGSHLAAHVRERPPLLPPPNALWLYNYSSVGPRDPQGRRCIDVFADELAGYFAPGGPLEAYDGLEFDVMFFVPDGRPQGVRFAMDQQLVDVHNDGVPDAAADRSPGFVDGVNVYGLGVTEFCRLLRDRLPGRFIMADAMMPAVLQRSFGILSGIESEGFPYLRDPDFADWSGGLNRFEFVKARSAQPGLNYQVFKYIRDENKPGIDPDAYQRLRLALAGAQFTDSCFALGEGWAPPPVLWHEGGVEVRVFDELWLGQEQRSNWLGQPVGAAVHLAAAAPDLFGGGGVSWRASFIQDWRRDGFDVTRRTGGGTGPHVEVAFAGVTSVGTSPDTGAPLHVLTLGEVELAGADLYVELRVSGAPLAGYPAEIARRYSVRARPATGGDPVGEVFSWLDGEPGTSTFTFRGIGPGSFLVELEVEGAEPVTLVRLTAHDHPDVMYREFEHGLVLANPAGQAYTFDLAAQVPGRGYRRIRGSDDQDPQTNDGQPVGDRVTVGAIDALFLARTDR